MLRPVNLPEDAETMFAGYVGLNFTPGDGLVFLAINPGGGGDAYITRTPEDELLYPLLGEFKRSTGDEVRERFEDVNAAFTRVLPHWNLWRIFAPTLAAAGRELDEIAYLNVVPYRTRQDRMPPVAARRAGWRQIVHPTLDLLNPRAVVTLGKKAGSVVDDMLGTALPHFCVPRVIGDTYVAERARAVHAEMRSLQK